MHGVTLTKRPADWSVIQQENGYGQICLEGHFEVHPAAIVVGVESVFPCFRVMNEYDNMPVIPWTEISDFVLTDSINFRGHFHTEISVPEGGPYRLETTLKTKSTQPNITWLYRGDCSMHLLIGDVFIIAGQSNSAGHAWDYCPDPPHLCVHLFRNNGRWDLAAHPMNESTDGGSLPNEEMGIPGISPYLSFGKKYYSLTGRPVGLVQTALGGSSISQWNPKDGELYKNMLSRIAMTGGKYAGVLWYQGCNDTIPSKAAYYYENFLELVTSLRRDLGYDIPFFTVQLNRQIDAESDESWGMVREAQRRAAMEIPGVSLMTTLNLSISDPIHNSAQANLVLGERLAMQAAGVLHAAQVLPFNPPMLQRSGLLSENAKNKKALDPQEIWLDLEFANVKGWFVLYSSKGSESGFTLEDENGEVKILTIRANLEDKNHVLLRLSRMPLGRCLLSFGWQADPVKNPVTDAVTYLCPAAFYKNEIRVIAGGTEIGKHD